MLIMSTNPSVTPRASGCRPPPLFVLGEAIVEAGSGDRCPLAVAAARLLFQQAKDKKDKNRAG